ncbi:MULTISPECIES: hypothetical protein [unclassified Sphingomonas]|uniref:hypothetical protein n=1 Tax=unclassified Sphingomonas TaxID=196159 RepID=UPI0012E0F4A7|nr:MULTISPECIES: hypothetical protein [unclassified Sphingomonas]
MRCSNALIAPMLIANLAAPSAAARPPAAASANGSWRWIRIEPKDRSPGEDAWRVQQGTSRLSRDGSGHFSTTLSYQGAGFSQQYRLTGYIKGRTVSAREVLQGSDAPPLLYRGALTLGGKCMDISAGLFTILLCEEAGDARSQ